MSRAGSPSATHPWLDDRRCLGVCVHGILLRNSLGMRELPIDHPCLTNGWWEVERSAEKLSRWTDGDAVLALPTLPGPTLLEIRVHEGSMVYLVESETLSDAA